MYNYLFWFFFSILFQLFFCSFSGDIEALLFLWLLQHLYCSEGMFGLDVCGVHSVCSVYEVSGLVAHVAPMGHWDWPLLACTALIAFMGIAVGGSGYLQHLFYLWSVWG